MFKQDGEVVKVDSMVKHFQESPATSQQLEYFTPLFWSGLLVSAAGGAFVGYGIGPTLAGSPADVPLIARGAVILGGGFYLASSANSKVMDAIRIHNNFIESKNNSATTMGFKFLTLHW